MGKYTSQEKTRKKRLAGAGKFLVAGLLILIGAVVIGLLHLPDDPYSGEIAYGIGLIVLFLIGEAIALLHKTLRKRKK